MAETPLAAHPRMFRRFGFLSNRVSVHALSYSLSSNKPDGLNALRVLSLTLLQPSSPILKIVDFFTPYWQPPQLRILAFQLVIIRLYVGVPEKKSVKSHHL